MRWALLAGSLTAGLLASTVYGEEFTPRPFVADQGARPLSTINASESANSAQWNARETQTAGTAFESTSAGNTLRWRVKQPAATVQTHSVNKITTTEPTPAKRLSFAERSRVQAASALEDPFGDRGRQVRLAQAEEAVDDADSPMGFNRPGQFGVEPPEEEAPEPSPMPEAPPAFPPRFRPAPPTPERFAPLPEPAPEANAGSLGKYNDRNCEIDGRVCAEHRDRIKSDLLIKKDSLIDITPPLVLSTDTEEQRERSLNNFRRNPAREWRNRAGEILAFGKLREVAYRHAIIESESGALVKIPLGELADNEQCFLAGWWNVPSECLLGDDVHQGRDFVPSTITWTASALCHKPLYFEEVQVERYGHSAGLVQPVLSGAHFFVNIAVLPYKMGINPPNECQYALGYYRPGSCAPWMIPPIPLSVRGAATQAAAVGIVYPLIP